MKYNASGTPQWFHAIGKGDDDGGASVVTDSRGNVYVTGWFRAATITAGNITIYNKNAAGGPSDMFLIKYDPNGNVLWAKNAGSQEDDKGRGCIVDADDNVIVTGYFKGNSIDIEGNFYANNGGKDAFVIKYSANGTLIAAKSFGGNGGEEAFACSADADGNIFLAGNYSSANVAFGNINLSNPGAGTGAFLVKLDPMLNTIWARGASSSSNDEARGCSTDAYGNTVITGVFNGSSIRFGNTTLNNNGDDEIFLAKYDPDGNLFWAKKAGKSKDDGANDCHISDKGRVLIAGYYNSSSIRFGTIDKDNSYQFVSTSDIFIANTCNSSTGIDYQTACDSYTWIDGKTYTSSNNTAVFNFPNGAANSCDSMLKLHLNILSPAVFIDTQIACDSYTWIDGKTYTNSNNTAVFNYPNGAANSCDSIVKLQLSIQSPLFL